MNWKETYTKVFLNELDRSTSEVAVKEVMPVWWQSTRTKRTGGLRLTEQGFDVILEIDIKTYEILYPKDMLMSTQVIIFLDQFIDCPYYITPKGITVTNEKKAVELSMFSGDLRKYGLVKALSKSKKNADNL